MKATIALFALILSSVGYAAAQPAADEKAIRQIIADQAEAWNAGDGARFSRHISPEVSFTNLFGMVMYGGDAFTRRQIEILSTFFKGTTKRHTVRKLRFVTPDVAIADIDNEVHGVKALPPGVAVPADGILRSQLMQVFVRRGDAWLVEAFHNVDVKPGAKR